MHFWLATMANAYPTPERLTRWVFGWYAAGAAAFIAGGLALWFWWPAN